MRQDYWDALETSGSLGRAPGCTGSAVSTGNGGSTGMHQEHGEPWEQRALLGALGCTGSMRIHERSGPGALGVLGTEGTLEGTGSIGMHWNWVPLKRRDAPGTPGTLRTDGMTGSSGSIRIPGGTGTLPEHWDVWEQREHWDAAGWSGMGRDAPGAPGCGGAV